MHVKMHVLNIQLVLCIQKLFSHCSLNVWSSARQGSFCSNICIAILISARAKVGEQKLINLGSNLGVPKMMSLKNCFLKAFVVRLLGISAMELRNEWKNS